MNITLYIDGVPWKMVWLKQPLDTHRELVTTDDGTQLIFIFEYDYDGESGYSLASIENA